MCKEKRINKKALLTAAVLSALEVGSVVGNTGLTKANMAEASIVLEALKDEYVYGRRDIVKAGERFTLPSQGFGSYNGGRYDIFSDGGDIYISTRNNGDHGWSGSTYKLVGLEGSVSSSDITNAENRAKSYADTIAAGKANTSLNNITDAGKNVVKELAKDAMKGSGINTDGPTIIVNKPMETKEIHADGKITTTGDIEAGGNIHGKGDLEIDGKAIHHGDTVVEGDTTVKGKTIHEGDVINKGNVTNEKDVVTKGNETVEKSLHVKGDTTLDGTLTVKDNATFEKDIRIKGNEEVDGDSHVHGNQTVDGDSIIKGNQEIQKNLTVDGDSHVKSSEVIDKDLTVHGNETIDGTLHVKDNAEFDKDLHAKGNSETDGDSFVHGNSSVDGDLEVKGNTKLGDDKTKDVVDVNAKTNLHGDTTIGDDDSDKLVVNATSEFNADTVFDKDVHIKGNAEVDKDLRIHGNIITEGDHVIEGDTYMVGDTRIRGNGIIDKDLTVGGDSHLGGDLVLDGRFFAKGAAEFGDSVDIAKNLTVGGNAHVIGDSVVDGDSYARSYNIGNEKYIDSNGINANNHKIRNVADGEIGPNSLDAVNGRQLWHTREALQHNLNQVGAGAAAMASLHPLDYEHDDKLSVSAAMGNYKDKTAMAVGAFYRPNIKSMINLSGTLGYGDNMFGIGVTTKMGKVTEADTMTDEQLRDKVSEIHDENKELREENSNLKSEVSDLKEKIAKFNKQDTAQEKQIAALTAKNLDLEKGLSNMTAAYDQLMSKVDIMAAELASLKADSQK